VGRRSLAETESDAASGPTDGPPRARALDDAAGTRQAVDGTGSVNKPGVDSVTTSRGAVAN
jgi:hypothetical protein